MIDIQFDTCGHGYDKFHTLYIRKEPIKVELYLRPDEAEELLQTLDKELHPRSQYD